MDKKSKILLVIMTILLLLSIFFTYVRTIVNKDFEVYREESEFLEEELK